MAYAAPALGRLERIALRDVWANEAVDFTPWLAREENIAILAEAIGLDLEVEAKEKNVGPFRADILCKDLVSGAWVLIENQLTPSDHTHLGQLLTYAAGLQAVTLVWVAERFVDEHRAVIDWLNEITDDRFNGFGLEIDLWRIGTSPVAPKFNVVCKPNDWTRGVASTARRIEAGLLSPRKQAYLALWQALAERIQATGSPLRHRAPKGYNYFLFAAGRSDFTLMASINREGVWVGLLCYDSRFWPALVGMRAEVEAEIGFPLIWDFKAGRNQNNVSVAAAGADLENRDTWLLTTADLQEKLEKLYAVFAPRIRLLEVTEVEDVPGPP